MVFLSSEETDAVTVCGGEALNQHSVRLYNVRAGEEHCTVRLEKRPQGMTSALFENITCVILSYKYVSAECPDITSCSFFLNRPSSGSRGGGEGAMASPDPVKISHKKDGRRRQPHSFHVSRPPLPGHWIRYCAHKQRQCFYTCLSFCSRRGGGGRGGEHGTR